MKYKPWLYGIFFLSLLIGSHAPLARSATEKFYRDRDLCVIEGPHNLLECNNLEHFQAAIPDILDYIDKLSEYANALEAKVEQQDRVIEYMRQELGIKDG
jgi:hypothetical protein